MFVRSDGSQKSGESMRGRQRWETGAMNAAGTLGQELARIGLQNAASTLGQELASVGLQGYRRTRTLISGV